MILEFLSGIRLMLALHLETASKFPEPLSKSEENEMLTRMLNGDSKAKNTLIERNLRLVAHITKKYYTTEEENDELLSVGTVGLIKAINSYNPDKGVKLATYAARCIDNEILMYFRGKKKNALDVSFEDPIETDSEGNPLTLMDIIAENDTILEQISLKNDTKRLLRYIGDMDESREKTILILRYGLDGENPMTQNEIARMFGISRSYVSRIETKMLKKLRKRFESEKEA